MGTGYSRRHCTDSAEPLSVGRLWPPWLRGSGATAHCGDHHWLRPVCASLNPKDGHSDAVRISDRESKPNQCAGPCRRRWREIGWCRPEERESELCLRVLL